MGDERDPNEETMDEGVPLDRELEAERDEDQSPGSNGDSRSAPPPALRPTDTDPEQLRIVDRSTISESAVTEANTVEEGLSRLTPLLASRQTESKTVEQAAITDDDAPAVGVDAGQLTQETAVPFLLIAERDKARETTMEELAPVDSAPTRKLPVPELDKVQKGASIPPSVLRRVMEGLDTDDPTVTARSTPPPDHPLEPDPDSTSEKWEGMGEEAPTEPMDQSAFVAGLAALNTATIDLEDHEDDAPTPASGQHIVSLADLVKTGTTEPGVFRDSKTAPTALEENSPTKQTQRPRARFVADERGRAKGPQRVPRHTSQPPRPAVIRSPKASHPARPVPPAVVRADTAPPPEASPETVEVRRVELPASKLVRPVRETKKGEKEIPVPGEGDGGGDGRMTVVKPKRSVMAKRLVSPSKPAAKQDPSHEDEAPPKAIPVKLAKGGPTAESKSVGSADISPAAEAEPHSGISDVAADYSHGSSGRFQSVLAAVIDQAAVMGVLRVVAGQAEGQIFPLVNAENSVGRGVDNDVVLLDLGVSRRHVTIVRHAEGFRMVDAGSGNGSFVNGVAVVETELYDGDMIRLGGIELEYRTQGAPRLPQAAPSRRTGLFQSRFAYLGLLTFMAAFLTMMLLDGLAPTAQERLAERAAVDWVAKADRHAGEKQWSDARRALTVSQTFGEQSGQADLDVRIERETENARNLRELEREIANQASIERLEKRLRSFDEESVYRGVAGLRVRAAKKATLERTLDGAEQDLKKGRTEAARLKIESVLRHNAAHPRAKTLLNGLN